AVGKVNVAKLANFAEVDVFCLVACAENSLLDSREFHAPVVTPLELEVALGKREWDGFYSTNFDDLLELEPPASERSGAASLWSSPAADFLGKREFKGLEALVGQTEAKAATPGQSGIASDYWGV
ncbi:unnamed protein product, partial [Ectocarpus sp. 4 AP-2014]